MQIEVVSLTQRLVRIPSENPVGTEEACARFVEDWLGELGVEVNASMEEIAASAQSLEQIAQELRDQVARFKV